MKKCVKLIAVGAFLCLGLNEAVAQPSPIRMNQLGFYPQTEKIAILVKQPATSDFVVVDAKGIEVLRGKVGKNIPSPMSGKYRAEINLSSITKPGKYKVTVDGMEAGFVVESGVLTDVSKAAIKAFYYQRAGMPIEERYAGKWNRPSGHTDNVVYIHPSAELGNRKAESTISSPKGWYDAGDYNKYIVNSGYSIGVMLMAYETAPGYYGSLSLNIPESTNSTPDLLDEIYYNLDWMFTMQDPADGGVYHKLTTPSFEGFVKPTECGQKRYVVQKSVTAALDFAASMAQASTIYSKYGKDYKGFSAKAIKAAEKAYKWAKANPEAVYKQNEMNKKYSPAIYTGEYGDNNPADEFFWAATELYLATKDAKYLEDAKKYVPSGFSLPSWGSPAALGCYSWIRNGTKVDNKESREMAAKMQAQLLDYAGGIVKPGENSSFHSPYGNTDNDFQWGSLSEVCANEAIALLAAYRITGDAKYLQGATDNSDYILGRNATGYCYVTGFGNFSPRNPHHRLSFSDGIDDPIPGLLVGGPNGGRQDKNDGAVYASTFSEESYSDTLPSYASNEIAINWNATLVALSGMLDNCLR